MPAESPSWTDLLGMGAAIAGQVAAGLLLGLLVDSLAGTAPVFLLVGVLLGVVGAAGFTIAQFRRYLRPTATHPPASTSTDPESPDSQPSDPE